METMTPAQLRRHVLGSEAVVSMIADKWRLQVLYALKPGTLRHGELQRALGGVSAKVLSQALRALERDGLIHRELYPIVPPKVEYSLTPLGRGILKPLRDLCHWHQTNAPAFAKARAQYDRASRRSAA
ncbi:MAG: helix-turn-helix domain-containing protein [Acidobacteriota bacterium]